MRTLTTAALTALLAAAACGKPAPPPPAEAPEAAVPAAPAPKPASAAGLPAGAYKIDPSHTSVIFRVNHLGFSHWTGRFSKVDAGMQLDPANPGAAQLKVTIDPKSIEADNAPAGFLTELGGPQWLDGGKFPAMTFQSTKVTPTGPDTADVAGDLTLRGVTKPVVLKARFNGGYAGHPMDPNARIGFSATTSLNRSDFGVSYGIPAPGTTMGVSDQVDVVIETEFTGPPLKTAAAVAP